jgi:Sigma-70, region 4
MTTPQRRTAVSFDDPRYDALRDAIYGIPQSECIALDPYEPVDWDWDPAAPDGLADEYWDPADLDGLSSYWDRMERPTGLNPIDPEAPDPDVDLYEETIGDETVEEALRFLRRLPARDRMVIYLRYGVHCEPQSTQSTASLMRILPMTVTRIEHRVLKELRLALGFGKINDEPEVGAPDEVAPPSPGEPSAPSEAA